MSKIAASKNLPDAAFDHSTPDSGCVRRDVLKKLLVTGIGALGAVSALSLRSNLRPEQRTLLSREYGTLEAPAFGVTTHSKLAALPTFDDLRQELGCDISTPEHANLSRRLVMISEKLSLLEGIFADRGTLLNPRAVDELHSEDVRYPGELLASVEEDLSRAGRDISKIQQQIKERLSLLDDRRTTWKHTLNRAMQESCAEAAERLGSPYSTADSILEVLTGKRMPDGVRFEMAAPAELRAAGDSNALDHSMRVRDQEYTLVVLTIIHEMGHLITQHDESRVIKGEVDLTRGESVFLEEAAAFGFELLAASWMIANSPEHATNARIYSESQIFLQLNKLYSGRLGHDPHPKGMAYLDAAWTVLGSLPDAVNYLLCHDRLTPEMERTVRRKAAEWRAPESTNRFKDVHKQYLALSAQFESLISRAGIGA